MHEDFVHITIAAKSLASIFCQHLKDEKRRELKFERCPSYLGDQVLRFRADLDAMLAHLRPANRRVLNQVIHLVLIWVVEWRDSNNHLIDQNAKRPPVESLIMS